MTKIARIDPELVAALEGLTPMVLTHEVLHRLREEHRATFVDLNRSSPPSPDVLTEDRLIPGPPGAPDVMVRIYRPASVSEKRPALLWIHGGGYMLGSVAGDDQYVRPLTHAVDCVVVSVEYRLAPEVPFPGPLEDCYAALTWLHVHAEALGVDPERIAIGGGSAGGGLAAGLGLLARDRREVPVCFEVLIYPMIDDRNTRSAEEAGSDHPLWDRAGNRFGWQCYLGAAPGGENVSYHAAPARAENLTGLPQTFIGVGELDLFLDENIEYARRLLRAGVPTELHVYPGAYHGFDVFVPSAEVSQRARKDVERALRHALWGYSVEPAQASLV